MQFSQLGMEAERRRKLADALQAQAANQPVASHMQGLAKVFASALGGYQQRRADDVESERRKLQSDALSQALDPTTDKSQMAQILASGGYEDAALKMAMETPKQQDVKSMAEQAVFKASRGEQLTPDEMAAVDAYNRIKGTEVMYDPRQNIVPKYQPLQLPGQSGVSQVAPALVQPNMGGMSADQQATGMPSDILPPPPVNEGQPGQTLAPPDGLDPKAQGAFMDAMAKDAAARAANGGMPDLTERQAKATSFAARMEQAEAEMGNILDANPGFNPSNVKDNVAASLLPPQFRNVAISPVYQQIRSAQENFITGLLRLDSGAAIPPAELESYIAQYFPVAGDSEATIEQKARARKAAMEATKAEAGAGYNYTGPRLENMGLGAGLPKGQPSSEPSIMDAVEQELKRRGL